MTVFQKIKNFITRNRVVPRGIYISFVGMTMNTYDKRFMNKYKLVESNFKNDEEESYAKALTQVCPYCGNINSMAYRSISDDMRCGCGITKHHTITIFHFYDEYIVTCPECYCKWVIVYNIDHSPSIKYIC